MHCRVPAGNKRAMRTVLSGEVSLPAVSDGYQPQVLRRTRDTHGCRRLARKLIGNNVQLYKAVVSDKKIKYLHLTPLKENVDPSWVAVALNAGYSAEEVARAIRGYSWSWSGNESDMWSTWFERFCGLCSHSDRDVREVGRIGCEDTAAMRDRALAREREEAVHGRW